ncbi:catalase [Tessaracoccus rhinocerotis]|uniref:Catalase n=1 Tax=Tessaracoccus rhinocerotis TaxID=1689449 RepID=A0A553K063_9ACTN|nr:catalase [Tessaracoccus rhinocerotis]TRY18092.1 catalase [Tessaracoccus rhinocerotis]
MTNPHTGSTTQAGIPAVSDRNSLSVGANGPIVLHDHHLVETLQHFNRMNVPERRPHAKGAGAFGEFEVTEDVSAYTKAAVFQPGAKTRVLQRFSTVAGELGSPDTWRDVRGFAIKFYTEEGNFDLVGNNTPVFFLRDPMKFPHFIRSQKRLPDSGLRDATMQWDFWTQNPESAHQVTYVMGDRGLPTSWRHMNGYGSHTYMWVNAQGEKFWVAYHFISQQGVENFTADEADKLAGLDAEHHRRDLFDNIAEGNFPKWDLYVQVVPYAEAKDYRFNIFDLTKTISKKDYPRIKVGTLTLNENPTNFFAQIEQAAFSPANMVPGMGMSPDKMLLGRNFAYADAQRYRIGTNFQQLPVNKPINEVKSYNFEGNMTYDHRGAAPVYAPNSFGESWSDETGAIETSWETDGDLVRSAYTLHAEDDDFGQAGTLYREVFTDEGRARFIDTLTGQGEAIENDVVLENFFQYWTAVDVDLGAALRERVNAEADAA